MGLTVNIKTIGFEEARRALKGVKNAFPKSMSRAINAGLKAGNALSANLINKRYNVKSGDIKSRMHVEKANFTKLDGELAAKGPMLPISLFSPKLPKTTKKNKSLRGKYLKVSIIRKQPKLLKKAFAAKGRIWERRPAGRIGIASTIGIPYMIGSLGIAKQVEDRITEQTAKRLEHEVQYELSKHH